MRLATSIERNEAIVAAKVGEKWLAPAHTLRNKAQRLFENPGYVLVCESEAWKECRLVVSESIFTPNVRNGERSSGLPGDNNTDPNYRWALHRNIALVRNGKQLFKRNCCVMIMPPLKAREWKRMLVIQLKGKNTSWYVMMQDEVLKCGEIRLPGLDLGAINVHSTEFYKSKSRGIECSDDFVNLSVQMHFKAEWMGCEAMTKRTLKKKD